MLLVWNDYTIYFILFFIPLILVVTQNVSGHMYQGTQWRVGNICQKLLLFFYHVSLGVQIKVINYGNKHSDLLSHLSRTDYLLINWNISFFYIFSNTILHFWESKNPICKLQWLKVYDFIKNSSELQSLFSSHFDPVAMELIHLSNSESFHMQSTLNTFIGNNE